MKRYALFAYKTFYPWGGWRDLFDFFDTIDECDLAIDILDQDQDYDDLDPINFHVVDMHTGMVVDEYDNGSCDPLFGRDEKLQSVRDAVAAAKGGDQS